MPSLGSSLATAQRWRSPRAGDPGKSEAVEAVARALLRRYGVVFRKVLERESASIPGWRELLITYRRLEARGEIRGGRFVAGFSGEQFALPEAVGLLRNARRLGGTDEMVTINAADPLNLVGVIVPGERIPLSARELILLRDGIPIATQSGREIRFMQELDSGEQWRARNALLVPVPGVSHQRH